MAKIYIPTDYLDKACYEVNDGYIRVWETINITSDNIVTDIYLNQDYQLKQQSITFDSTIQCDNLNTYTDDIYYRVDMPQILIMFTIICIFTVLVPIKVLFRFFRRFN